MNAPLFISLSAQLLPNWQEAFPHASLSKTLSEAIDGFDRSLIFLDVQGRSTLEKYNTITKSVATGSKVFVLSPTPTEREAVEVIKAGAIGYGHTYSASSRLQKMAMVVEGGGLWVGSELFKRVMSALNRSEELRSDERENSSAFDSLLTQREADVACCVANGATNAEIAAMLNVTERTIKGYVTAIFEKLNVRNRVELALLLHNIRISKNPIERKYKKTVL